MEILSTFWPVLLFLVVGGFFRLVPDDFPMRHKINPNGVYHGVRLNLGVEVTAQSWAVLKRRAPLIGVGAGLLYTIICVVGIYVLQHPGALVMKIAAIGGLVLFFVLFLLFAIRNK